MSAKSHGRQAAAQAFGLQMRFGEEKVALVPTMHLSRSEITS
jgi:hypothetical protein